MNEIKLLPLRSPEDNDFEKFWRIYEQSFPANERREKEALSSMLILPEMHAFSVKQDSCIVGVLVYWNMGDFIFLEHIGIDTSLRSKGIGKMVLSLLLDKKKPIVLEVEEPSTEESLKRIRFYERNGYHSYDSFSYKQPSYDGIKPAVPMMLMANSAAFTDLQLSAIAATIRKVAYERFYH